MFLVQSITVTLQFCVQTSDHDAAVEAAVVGSLLGKTAGSAGEFLLLQLHLPLCRRDVSPPRLGDCLPGLATISLQVSVLLEKAKWTFALKEG